jgi:hypothetical protein
MSDPRHLRQRTVEAIAALRSIRADDDATARLAHASLLTAATLERWWLPLLDDPVDDSL